MKAGELFELWHEACAGSGAFAGQRVVTKALCCFYKQRPRQRLVREEAAGRVGWMDSVNVLS
jgi:hypothetical protein